MGINLIPELSDFAVRTYYFRRKDSSDPITPGRPILSNGSVEEGCVSEGEHKILVFTTEVFNRGNENLVIGNPANRQDIFEPAPHMPSGWITRDKFYEFALRDNTGAVVSNGFKRAWCIQDHSPTFDCNHQGISIGDHDEYTVDQNCQFVLFDGMKDGEYVIEAVINPTKIFKEDNYDDNKATKRIKIRGRIVTEI